MINILSERSIIYLRPVYRFPSFKNAPGILTSLSVMVLVVALLSSSPNDIKKVVVWKIHDTTSVNGIRPIVLGSPRVVKENKSNSLMFDGVDDGLIMPVNPLEGMKSFTVELLFKPAVSDSLAPRMLHIQDNDGNRCTIELRITRQGKWYLDAFLKNGKMNKGLTLFDSAKQHLCEQWYWVALTYDGTKMAQYLDGVKESEGTVALDIMQSGQTSIGVRLNHINWFKGQIKEIRFSSTALKPGLIQRKK